MMYTEAHILDKVDLCAILNPFNSNQCLPRVVRIYHFFKDYAPPPTLLSLGKSIIENLVTGKGLTEGGGF